ncbi:MAG: RuBisCO large subunit C-terminal-like domain-containing protein, partial [Planctomycetia bacterium]|nr:RuBisCO large subunit C-terminal-like domain-containing protein [Planctomycetia bacterium]
FGIEGIRSYLGTPRRPLLANINKPFTGRTPEEGAKLFHQAARGGSDIIKDDELLGDSSYSKALSRAKLFMQMEKRAFEETGERTIYAVNITDRPDRMMEKARRAVELGASGLMVNFLSVGISALSMLAEDDDICVPILAHLDICGTMCASGDHGISAKVLLGLLPRLAGADLVIYPCPYGLLDMSRAEYLQVAEAHRAEMGNLKPTFPAPAGGVHPGMVEALTRDLRLDYIVGAGSSVHMHPMGTMCGARAFRQAIDATVEGVGLAEAAQEHSELRAAIDLWGVLPTPPA